MAGRTASALILLVLAGCGGAPAPPEREDVPTVVQDDAELLHRSDAQMAATLDDLAGLGVDWVRVTAGWSVIAPPDRPPSDPADPRAYPPSAWDKLDRLAAMAAARDLELAIDIAFWAPAWAVPVAPAGAERLRRDIDAERYGDFAEAVARRYPQAVAFTVWNEPNHPVFLMPQWERRGGRWLAASPHRYREMLDAAVPRIRAAAPEALVLIGGTSSVGFARGRSDADRMAPLTFLRELACVDGAGRPLRRRECRGFTPLPGDGWSHHPYSDELWPTDRDPEPENARIGDLGRLTGALEALHAGGRTQEKLPVYISEFGFQTDPPDPTAPWSLEEQARGLAEAERIALSHPEVRSTSQFLVRDLPARPGDDLRSRWSDFQSGLRFADGRAKPAHAAFALPVIAERDGDGARVWGRVRPGTGERTVRVEVRTEAGWRELATTRSDGAGVVDARVRPGEGRALRLVASVDGRDVRSTAVELRP